MANPNHDEKGKFSEGNKLRGQIKEAMASVETGNRNSAQRLINAHKQFAESLMNIAGISEEDAHKAIEGFRKAKVLKTDMVGGRMSVKHGAYLEPDVIKRAVNFKGDDK